MSVWQYNPKERYRDRAVQKFNRTVLVCIFMIISFSAGFFIGGQNAVVNNGTLKMEVEDLNGRLKSLQDELTTVRAEAQTSSSRLEQLKGQYEKDLPQDGPMRDIIEMVKKQIDDGMAPDRLAFVIRSARPPRNCSDPASKRFMIKTPAYKGADSVVSVGEGAVVVSGVGASARSKEGQQESWFDPTQPVHVTFKTANGEVENKAGVLPFQHSIISAGKEYRFTLAEGEKSFVKVTFDSCDYP